MDEVQNPDLLLILLAFIFAPMVFVAVMAMFRNYHVWLHIYRGDKNQHEDKEDHG